MEGINLTSLTSGFRERMRRVALLDSLSDLSRKREKDQQETKIDIRSLGMLTLLFFFERQLSRQYKTSKQHVTLFLQSVMNEKYVVNDEQITRIADTIITTFRPGSGFKRKFPFYNWETNEKEEIEYSILKDSGHDIATNTQYYMLDEDGLELLFATKEFYSEFQISINQLLLRQKINKGEFHGALMQIREMELSVNGLKDRIEKMQLEISRSIVSEETYERYKELLDDTYARLEQEDDEFKALNIFIEQTRDTIYTGDTKHKEQGTYQLLVQIINELEAVHYKHTDLLTKTAELRNTALEMAQETLYYTGVQSFNFDIDIISTILSKPLPPDAMKGVLHPFLKVEENRTWSPLAIIFEQNIIGQQGERVEEGYYEAEANQQEETYRAWLGEKYSKIMHHFLTAYETKQINTLAQFMEYIETVEQELLAKRYFYSFWLLLHQRSPIFLEKINEQDDEEQTILGETLLLLGNRRLNVKETSEIISYHKRYSIQDMTITFVEELVE